MTPQNAAALSNWVLKLALMGLAFAATSLLLRDILALPAHVALGPLEGWNAYHAEAALAHAPLYPRDLMVNTYPPLSFYLLGALGKLTGDAIIAGRIVSLIAFAALVTGLMALMRQLGATVLTALFTGLVFGLVLLATAKLVAVNDPALLGHALQLQGLLFLLRARPVILAAALMFVLGLFVKFSLLALPLAGLLWLLPARRRDAAMLGGAMLGLVAIGLGVMRLGLDADLSDFVPRLVSWADMRLGNFLLWAALPFAVTAWLARRFAHDRWVRFAALYAASALAMAFAAPGGIQVTDCAMALALAGGLALTRFAPPYRGVIALAYGVPLALYLGLHFRSGNFAYREIFQRQTRLDIALLEVNRGPALCENLALCYWAGEPQSVDVPGLSQAFAAGQRGDGALAGLLARGHYRSVQLASLHPFALGPHVKAALDGRYRIQRRDNNGVFLLRRQDARTP